MKNTSNESTVQYEETPVEQSAHPRARSGRAGRHAEAGRGRIHSGDASRYAYTVYGSVPRRPSHVVVDGRECPPPSARRKHFVFSPDGSRVAYVADDGNGETVICDGIPGRSYDLAEPPALQVATRADAPNAARRRDSAMVVSDGAEGPSFLEVGDVMFSSDGARLAYWGMWAPGSWR